MIKRESFVRFSVHLMKVFSHYLNISIGSIGSHTHTQQAIELYNNFCWLTISEKKQNKTKNKFKPNNNNNKNHRCDAK